MKIKKFGKINDLAFQDTIKCLHCGEDVVKPDIYYDKNGTYVSCPHCKESFDVDVWVIKHKNAAYRYGFSSENAAKSFLKSLKFFGVSAGDYTINLIR